MVVCTGEVVGKVAGTDLLRRSMGVLGDDKMIVHRTIHRSIDEATVEACQGGGTGVSKTREDDEGGEDGLRNKRRGMKASVHGNVPDDSTLSKVSARHYCCCCHCY